MSVVLKMDMPITCSSCRFQDVGLCYAVGDHPSEAEYIPYELLDKAKPEWCPIIGEIPDSHGRLVDADALIVNKFKNPISYNAFTNLINRQMTVVKAEGDEA